MKQKKGQHCTQIPHQFMAIPCREAFAYHLIRKRVNDDGIKDESIDTIVIVSEHDLRSERLLWDYCFGLFVLIKLQLMNVFCVCDVFVSVNVEGIYNVES
eukprot:206281_1